MGMKMKTGIIKLNSYILGASTVVGKKEHDGPLGKYFDIHDEDDSFGQKTWEKSEAEMQRLAANLALKKCGIEECELGAIFAGDLINQCTGSAYGLLELNVPFFGLYGACSTAAEGLILASVMTSLGVYRRTMAVVSSHNCSAERQFRTPIEYGSQKAPTAQWTVTGSGAFILECGSSELSSKARIVDALPGISIEKGINDAANMGAAMAPAAADTLLRYFDESGSSPNDFDVIATGDLGFEGSSILRDILHSEGVTDGLDRLNDCGMMIYSRRTQDVHSGGSGCGCSAVVLGSYLLPRLERGEIKDMLFVGTGALMSPDSIKQGLGIPAIAHLVHIKGAEKNG